MRLSSFTPQGRDLLQIFSPSESAFFPKYNGELEEELVIITPHLLDLEKDPGIPEHYRWQKIHKAWHEIQSGNSREEIQSWRVIWEYGKEIPSGLRIFQLRHSALPRFFYLLSEDGIEQSSDQLIQVFLALSAWRHITRSRIIFHAAGVISKNKAYLFVGPSGAGKTTAAGLSVLQGCAIIHDDGVLVASDRKGRYVVTSRTISIRDIPLAGIFFLFQSATNKLIQISPIMVAKKLLQSSYEVNGHQLLSGCVLQQVFATCASIARSIPGYELQFRKSPDFWELIDAEFSD